VALRVAHGVTGGDQREEKWIEIDLPKKGMKYRDTRSWRCYAWSGRSTRRKVDRNRSLEDMKSRETRSRGCRSLSVMGDW